MRMCVIVLLDNCRVPFLIANVRAFNSRAFVASYEPRVLYVVKGAVCQTIQLCII